MDWLKTWAAAVVEASKADSAERLLEKSMSPASSRLHPTENPSGNSDDSIHIPHRFHRVNTRGSGSHHPDIALQDVSDASTATAADLDDQSSVMARRRAMKAFVRRKYAFKETAKLWAAEFELERR